MNIELYTYSTQAIPTKLWKIEDWAGNSMTLERFESFEDAEHALSIMLDDKYDTDREEYYILEER